MSTALHLTLLTPRYAVCRLGLADLPRTPLPPGPLSALVRTGDILTLVCEEAHAPEAARCERGWRALEVAGPLEFDLIGILARLTSVLAEAGVSVYALSSFDTDYLLVKAEALERATSALRRAGHHIGDTHDEPARGGEARET